MEPELEQSAQQLLEQFDETFREQTIEWNNQTNGSMELSQALQYARRSSMK